jgi:hypothetical protein
LYNRISENPQNTLLTILRIFWVGVSEQHTKAFIYFLEPIFTSRFCFSLLTSTHTPYLYTIMLLPTIKAYDDPDDPDENDIGNLDA